MACSRSLPGAAVHVPVCVCVCLVSSFHEHTVQPAAVVACSLNICGVNTNSTKAPFPQGKHWRIQCVNAWHSSVIYAENRAIFPSHCINNSGVAEVGVGLVVRGFQRQTSTQFITAAVSPAADERVCCWPRLPQ